jgi:hypothetical protein
MEGSEFWSPFPAGTGDWWEDLTSFGLIHRLTWRQTASQSGVSDEFLLSQLKLRGWVPQNLLESQTDAIERYWQSRLNEIAGVGDGQTPS